MRPTEYDPSTEPDAPQWLATHPMERLRQVVNHHVQARIRPTNAKAHAALHVAVENLLASGHGPSKRAMQRLQSQGSSRHEAIHALGTVVTHIHAHSVHAAATELATLQTRMNGAIDQLAPACDRSLSC